MTARITHAETQPTIDLDDWNADHVIEDLVADDDPRLSDARTPIAHTHPYASDSHTHDTTHDHDGDYAPAHAHPYASDSHQHDADYAAVAHGTHLSLGTTAGTAAEGDHSHPGGFEAFPVGSLFLSAVSTNPATLLGYGTWQAFGDGRLLMSEDTAGQTGGSSTHTHAAHSGVLSHSHNVTDAGHAHAQQRFPTATGGSTGFTVDTSMSGTQAAANNTASATTGLTVNSSGSGSEYTHDSPSHLPPYITVRVWERTA